MIRRSITIILIGTVLTSCGTNEAERNSTITAVKDSTATTAPVATPNGPQIIHLKEGGRLEGEMSNGLRTGVWTSFHPNGSLWSRSTYVNGVEEGITEVFTDKGIPYYKGAYLHGRPFGEWTYFDKSGREVKRVVHDSTGAVLR